MEIWIQASIHWLLATLALPKVGLSAIFVVSLVSATLLPLGSEPAVFAYAKTVPDMFWPAVLAATVGNTLGGIITYYMGLAAEKAFERWKEKHEHAVAEHGQVASHRLKPAASLQKMGGRWHLLISRWSTGWGRPPCFFPGCRLWATLCARSAAGCGFPSGRRSFIWRWASFCGMQP